MCPFITPENRRKTDAIGAAEMGDRCFIAYRKMLGKWKKSRRWTTAHEIYAGVMERRHAYYSRFEGREDDLVANELAWQVFFIRHVMVYENEKAAINGEVETDA